MHTRSVIVGMVAAIATIALLGGCSSSSSPTAAQKRDEQLAAKDLLGWSRLGDAEGNALAAKYDAQQRRSAATAMAAARARAQQVGHASQILRTLGFSVNDLCSKVPPASSLAQRQARRALELRRKQALYYLNLHCPSR